MNSLITDTIVSFIDFRKNLTTYINRVRRGQPISVTDGKKADVMIVKRDEIARLLRRIENLEALVETYELLTDPKAMNEIRRSEEDIAAGRFVTLEELEVARMAELNASRNAPQQAVFPLLHSVILSQSVAVL